MIGSAPIELPAGQAGIQPDDEILSVGRVGERTVYLWRKLFKQGAIDALRPRRRSDRGRCRKIDDDVVPALGVR